MTGNVRLIALTFAPLNFISRAVATNCTPLIHCRMPSAVYPITVKTGDPL